MTEEPPGPPERPSLALAGLLSSLRAVDSPRVLDLGPALGGNVTFFGRQHAQFYVADLFRALTPKRSRITDSPHRLDDFFRQQLPGSDAERFHLVLAWDLLDYMTERELQSLGAALAERVVPGGSLFASVGTLAAVPPSPLRYEIVDERTIRHHGDTTAVRPAPRHKEPTLKRLFPEFHVDSSYLLRHGAQEYVLARTAGPAPPEETESPTGA